MIYPVYTSFNTIFFCINLLDHRTAIEKNKLHCNQYIELIQV